ncbi:DNA-processing protein DprA [Luteimonas sp BLCC-B24]|uniref:DNA-processing protein DprA n=1 Tax=Luteimonas sp. BLCC-B24 TaxID=3025317 RepID=UPI00234C525F|nr:DNA-processing protein DprA [Luteimonas sp. BLCC-B24]MDC7806079.1 DNA-processing protein DprA [Luteimonas sp. BLCC-B24]
MPDRSDATHRALLTLIHAGGAAGPRRGLLETTRSPQAALDAGPATWRAAGLDDAQCAALRAPDAAVDRSRHWLEAGPRRHLIGWHDPDYPDLLRRAPSPPLALFVEGDPLLLWQPGIAIVGSRAPTAGGRDNASQFARHFASNGLAVVSGLASGIDAAAHEATLGIGGATVAVLGSGIDIPYPRSNTRLHGRLAAEGAVVSEYPPGTPARREQFPSRNRIVAGLTLGTLVVEAAYRSGALITARLAAESGREVFAIPGSIHNPMARGCHRLLREGAQLVEAPEEVTAALGPLAASLAGALRTRLGAPIQDAGTPDSPSPQPAAAPDPDYNRLWNALAFDPSSMDDLVARSGLTVARVSAMLLVMELDGRVETAHGRYCRKS